MLISFFNFIIPLITAQKYENKLINCFWDQCSIEDFQKEYKSREYSKIIILIQVISTIILKFIFLENITEQEKKAEIANVSPKRFTLFLYNIDKNTSSGDIIKFFEHDLNRKLRIIKKFSKSQFNFLNNE